MVTVLFNDEAFLATALEPSLALEATDFLAVARTAFGFDEDFLAAGALAAALRATRALLTGFAVVRALVGLLAVFFAPARRLAAAALPAGLFAAARALVPPERRPVEALALALPTALARVDLGLLPPLREAGFDAALAFLTGFLTALVARREVAFFLVLAVDIFLMG